MIKSVTQHSYFEKKLNKQMGRLQNNLSIGWVHPRSTHDRPLTWGNENSKENLEFDFLANVPQLLSLLKIMEFGC